MKCTGSLGFRLVLVALAALCAFPAIAGAAGTWTVTGTMNAARGGNTATLLLSGKVLVVGGYGNAYDTLSSAERYDPATGLWTSTGSMAVARYGHAAALLPDGRVLVTGGSSGAHALSSAELYDPATGTWAETDSMDIARRMPTLTLLGNGKVLVAGGHDDASRTLSSAELYDPATGMWTSTGAMSDPRSAHTATLLGDGTVLVAGGYGAEIYNTSISSAERYDPATGAWSTVGSMTAARFNHTATRLRDGTVLVAGGADSTLSAGALSSIERYDPSAGTWSPAGPLGTARIWHTATLLPEGAVLVVGGSEDFNGALGSGELYDPASGAWSDAGSLTTGRTSHTATLLSTGVVLIAGGRGSSPAVTLSSAELYAPATSLAVGHAAAQVSDCVSLEITVTPEAMTVTPSAKNPTRIAVPWQGKPSGPFLLAASFAQERDGCYGTILGTPVTCTLTPEAGAAPAGPLSDPDPMSYTRTVHLLGLPGPQATTAAFAFFKLPVGDYAVHFSVADGRYQGEADGSSLSITQPPLVWQRWVEPSASSYRVGSTIRVAFLLKYGVSTDQATFAVTGPGGDPAFPLTFDPVSGQHQYIAADGTDGLLTRGWPKGSYTLRIDLPNGTSQYKTIRLK